MKLSKILLTVSLVVFFSVGMVNAAQAAPVAGTFPVGVVDFLYLVNNHPDTAKANEQLKAEQELAHKEFDAKSAGLSEKDRQALDIQLGQRVEQKRQEMLKPIVESVNAAMKSVAEAKGLSMVVFKASVAMGGTDITEDVLKKLTGK